MKILLLAPTHASFISRFLAIPERNLPAGHDGAPFLGTLIEEFLSRGHQVISVTTTPCINNDYSTKTFQNGNFQWIIVPARKHSFRNNGNKLGRAVDFFALECKQLVKVIKEVKPDIVHAHWSYEFAAAAIKAGFPHLVTVHDNHWIIAKHFKNAYRFVRAIMAERNFFRLQGVTTVSPYMASFLNKRKKSVEVVPNPVRVRKDIDQIEYLIDERISKINTPQIVMINNGWKGTKNGLFGVQVFHSLSKEFKQCRMHLVGAGSEPGGPAHRDAVRLGIDHMVHCHGRLSQEDLFALLQNMHILLHTSKEESFGVVLVESASVGVPAFGNKCAGAVSWVIGQEKLLYTKWNAYAVSKQICNILRNPPEYKELAIQSYERVCQNFSIQAVASQYLVSYRNNITSFNRSTEACKKSAY